MNTQDALEELLKISTATGVVNKAIELFSRTPSYALNREIAEFVAAALVDTDEWREENLKRLLQVLPPKYRKEAHLLLITTRMQ